MSANSFSNLNLQPKLQQNLVSLGYKEMTPIQAKSLPLVLNGKDIIAQAQTGSGKTAAFGLGLLEKLNVKQFRIQSLVLCPTRELADQVANEVRRLARMIHNVKILTICGGANFGVQVGSLEHGAHIVVGTPGRIADHLRKRTLSLAHVNTLVLDEADRMLDMGFQDVINSIVERIPMQRQTLLFSATFPERIQSIADSIMRSPQMIQIESTHDDKSIEQYAYLLIDRDRINAVQLLLLEYQPSSCVVFCNTKVETQSVADQLAEMGFDVQTLHGDLEQRERDQTLARFANHSISVLVATDVAARGLDIKQLDAVINYQLPRDASTYLHRIGRTGRAGNKGLALSLYQHKETFKLENIENYLDKAIVINELPKEELLAIKPYWAPYVTLQIDAGKKQKLRPGDILGALTANEKMHKDQIGKINIYNHYSYVAVERAAVQLALQIINQDKLKGRSFKARKL